MNYLSCSFLIFLLISSCQNLTLEGSWILDSILSTSGLNLSATITEQIFREQQIINKIEFKGCQTVAYQLNVQDDNIYINIETERSIPVRTCDKEGFDALRLVKRWIRGILKFEIKNNKLTFMDPSYDPVFQFTRTTNKTREDWSKSIRGNWMARKVDDSNGAQTIAAYDADLTLCQGAIFDYKIEGLYYISLKLKSKGECKDENLLKALSEVKFYQRFGNTLQLYDNTINLLFSALDTKRPLENITNVTNASSPAAQNVIEPLPQGKISGFASGKYYLLLLFKRSLGRVILDLTENTLSFKICSQLTLSYSIKQKNQISFQTRSKPDSSCFKADETIYSDTLSSIDRFSIDADGTITLIDNQSKNLVSLTKK